MSTRKSLVFSFLDRYASLAISVGSSMLIARLLTPAEIGVFSVTMVLLVFVSTFRDMGAGQYLVQEKELTTQRIRAVWTVQLGLGLALACLVLMASYPVSLFYNEPRMFNILLVVAFNYAINPFGSLTYAWLMREMRFESVALMRFTAALVGALVSAWLAWQNYGPISLAFGSLASTITNALIATYFRPKSFPWLPGISEIRRVLVFGSKLTASSIVSIVGSSAPELMLGKLQNLAAVGFYSRAAGLLEMFHRLFVEAVAVVCLPWFSAKSRENGSFAEPFLKATAYITAIGWSFCLAVLCLAFPIIRVLYGDQWDQSVDLVRVLSVATALGVPAALCKTALLSTGAVSAIARASVQSALQTVLLVALGASHGLMMLAFAMVISASITSLIWLRTTLKHLAFPFGGLLHMLIKSAAVALMSAIGPSAALWIYGPATNLYLYPLLIGGFGGLIGFIAGVTAFKHPLQEEIMPYWLKIKNRLI